MTKPTYDQAFWDQLWSKTLREHADKVAARAPNALLVREIASLAPGRVLDAGCGHGAETLWLAAHGWHVTAVDFAASALAQGASMAEAAGLAGRIDWVEGDIATWPVPPAYFDLVVSLCVHVAGSVEAMVHRMASGVAVGGTLFLVGHRPVDPATGAATAAAGQVQVSVEGALAALEPRAWEHVLPPSAAAGYAQPRGAPFLAATPKPIDLFVARSRRPASVSELTPLEREQLRIALRGFDEEGLDAQAGLTAEESERAFLAIVQIHTLADGDGNALYDAFTYVDQGAIFRAGTSDEIGGVAQAGVTLSEPNEELRVCLQSALFPHAPTLATKKGTNAS